MATVQRTLQRSELRILAILGVPTFALALAITTVSTYLPVLAGDFSDSSIVIGLLIGGEGLVALWLPLVVGSWSDRLRTPLGSRLPFILAATPALVVALAVLGFVQSIAQAAIVVAVFFVAYFVAYEPYRALYPDLVDHEIAGRAQSSQAIFRGLGLPRPRRRRPAHLGLRSAALPRRRAHRRAVDGRLLRRGGSPPQTRATGPGGGGRRGRAPRGRPGVRPARPAGLPGPPTRSGSWRWRR